jgi:hypothetical protein
METSARDTNIIVTNVGEVIKHESNRIEVVNIDSNDVIFIWYDTKTTPAAIATTQLREVEEKFKKILPNNRVVTLSSSISISVMKQPG